MPAKHEARQDLFAEVALENANLRAGTVILQLAHQDRKRATGAGIPKGAPSTAFVPEVVVARFPMVVSTAYPGLLFDEALPTPSAVLKHHRRVSRLVPFLQVVRARCRAGHGALA